MYVLYSAVLNNRGFVIKGGLTDNLNTNKWGEGGQIKGGGRCLKNVLSQKWQPVITNYGCPKFFVPYLDIVDTGATITLNKIRKANQSNFTGTQSRNIQIYVFETFLIQLYLTSIKPFYFTL